MSMHDTHAQAPHFTPEDVGLNAGRMQMHRKHPKRPGSVATGVDASSSTREPAGDPWPSPRALDQTDPAQALVLQYIREREQIQAMVPVNATVVAHALRDYTEWLRENRGRVPDAYAVSREGLAGASSPVQIDGDAHADAADLHMHQLNSSTAGAAMAAAARRVRFGEGGGVDAGTSMAATPTTSTATATAASASSPGGAGTGPSRTVSNTSMTSSGSSGGSGSSGSRSRSSGEDIAAEQEMGSLGPLYPALFHSMVQMARGAQAGAGAAWVATSRDLLVNGGIEEVPDDEGVEEFVRNDIHADGRPRLPVDPREAELMRHFGKFTGGLQAEEWRRAREQFFETKRRMFHVPRPSRVRTPAEFAEDMARLRELLAGQRLDPKSRDRLTIEAFDGFLHELRQQEQHLASLQREHEYERVRPPQARWYTLKDTRFGVEARRAREMENPRIASTRRAYLDQLQYDPL